MQFYLLHAKLFNFELYSVYKIKNVKCDVVHLNLIFYIFVSCKRFHRLSCYFACNHNIASIMYVD